MHCAFHAKMLHSQSTHFALSYLTFSCNFSFYWKHLLSCENLRMWLAKLKSAFHGKMHKKSLFSSLQVLFANSNVNTICYSIGFYKPIKPKSFHIILHHQQTTMQYICPRFFAFLHTRFSFFGILKWKQ